MIRKRQTGNPESKQLRMVVLLLAGAVILPTACLLWFMNQAVKNERLAIKEKLVSVYDNSLKTSLEKALEPDRIRLYLTFAEADGYLIFDSNDNFIFPVVDAGDNTISEEIFSTAYKLEYTSENPADAIEEYDKVAETTEDDTLKIKADIASARCLKKINRTGEAIERLHEVINKYSDNTSHLITYKVRAWLLLVELLQQEGGDEFISELSAMYDYTADNIATDDDLYLFGTKQQTTMPIPTSLQLFVLERFLLYAEPIKEGQLISKKVKRAEIIMPKLKLSLEMSNIFKDLSFITMTGTNSHIFRLDTEEQFYAQYMNDNSKSFAVRKYLKIYYQPTIEYWLKPYLDDMNDLSSQCGVYDEKGDLVAGTSIADRDAFIKTELDSAYFPEWTTKIYIHSSAFTDAANKQIAVYIWAGVLVIVMMLAVGGFAVQTIGRQMKLNKLKNDFIATISHELKTPLASMRVLADTLLEGNYSDQHQVTEYLQLICRENKRLTGLIDNFLTFSRMERSKQAFELQETNPADIARAAAEAVEAKFDKKICTFIVTIDEDLPFILVDKDAIVTVLVNLLDNAYKYSCDKKRIALKVFSKDNSVCFMVRDNGIGMNRWQIKKIFNRFYQADSSLSRKAEGTGLGLSIVKFILDAHKAKIEVESKTGKGSIFTVKLPAYL